MRSRLNSRPSTGIGGAAQLAIAGGNVLQLAFPDEFDADLRVLSAT